MGTTEQTREKIRNALKAGRSVKQIMAQYKVSAQTVGGIKGHDARWEKKRQPAMAWVPATPDYAPPSPRNATIVERLNALADQVSAQGILIDRIAKELGLED